MTGEELARLPVGTVVRYHYGDSLDGSTDEGEVIQAGREVHIMWPKDNRTAIVDTQSKNWQTFIRDLEVE
jgi:hypothetical protein